MLSLAEKGSVCYDIEKHIFPFSADAIARGFH